MDEQSTPRSENAELPKDSLSSMLSDPALLEQIGSILRSVRNSTDLDPPPKDSAAPPVSAASTATSPVMSEGISALLSHPEILRQLPQMLSLLSPMLSGKSEKILPPSGSSKGNAAETHREALLLALKPFLSPPRRDAVDGLLRIGKLGAVLRELR